MGSRMLSRKSVAVGIVIGLVIGLPSGFFLLPQVFNAFNIQIPSDLENAGYKKLTVVANQGATIKFGEDEYAFTYTPKDAIQNGTIIVATPITIIPNTFPAVIGATYTFSGIEFKVSEVHPSYVVLMVKSTVP